MSLTDYDQIEFLDFRLFLEKACGIILTANKQYLVSSRLAHMMRENDIASLRELVNKLEAGTSSLRTQVIEAMTTNETQWFRDLNPFVVLEKTIFPELSSDHIKKARIWSAACSYGQEAYSISMTLDEYNRTNNVFLDAEIVGTDISLQVVNAAATAQYNDLTVDRGLSEQRKKRYFTKSGHLWQLNSGISERVSFKQLNLLHDYQRLGKFDVIFCRNVLIYFSSETKKDIVTRLTQRLKPGGFLFVGSSEAIIKCSDRYRMFRSDGGIYYRLK